MANRAIVIDMIWESSSRGAAVPGLFHDEVTGNTPCSEVVQNGHAGTAG
jgi:alpha-D-ribose 1-methylphosphonate 5-triphosphate synthase subunit PhnL